MSQLAIDFDSPPHNPPEGKGAPRLQGLAAAREAGRRGAKLALDRAEREDAGFGARAQRFILDYLSRHPSASGEEITCAAKRAGIVPEDDRAFGGVYGGLARRGAIVQCGECSRVRGHGTAGGRIWRLGAA